MPPATMTIPNSTAAAPQAYLLTSGGGRGQAAATLLRVAGFTVQRVPPVVPRWDRHAKLLPRRWMRRLNQTYTNRSFSAMLTHREIYARIGRNAAVGRSFEYIFEDDIAMHASFAPADIPSILAVAESTALANGSDIIYLGGCRTYRKHARARALVGGRRLGLSRCAVLCTHAYGVSKKAAARFISLNY